MRSETRRGRPRDGSRMSAIHPRVCAADIPRTMPGATRGHLLHYAPRRRSGRGCAPEVRTPVQRLRTRMLPASTRLEPGPTLRDDDGPRDCESAIWLHPYSKAWASVLARRPLTVEHRRSLAV